MSTFNIELPVIADLIEGDEISTAEALGLSRESERAIMKIVKTEADNEDAISVCLQRITQNEKITELNQLVFAIFEFGKITQRQICAALGHNGNGVTSFLGSFMERTQKGVKDLSDILHKAREAGGTVIVGMGKDGFTVETEEEFIKNKKDASTDGTSEPAPGAKAEQE